MDSTTFVALALPAALAMCASRVRLPVRVYSQGDTVWQMLARLRTCGRMMLNIAAVMATDGPGAAFSWVDNAWRLSFDPSLGRGFTHTIEARTPIVSGELSASIGAVFQDRATSGEVNAFAQSGQSILYQHDFPTELQPALESLYSELLEKINAELPALRLHPIKASFAERYYAIDYPGPTIELPFHYDCNDASDYKAQILIDKSPGAPALSVSNSPVEIESLADSDVRPFDENKSNICVFHPHSTYHGLQKGSGHRRVLICTFTQLAGDHRPLVCHADLISKS